VIKIGNQKWKWHSVVTVIFLETSSVFTFPKSNVKTEMSRLILEFEILISNVTFLKSNMTLYLCRVRILKSNVKILMFYEIERETFQNQTQINLLY
jgi:hypothetical protein